MDISGPYPTQLADHEVGFRHIRGRFPGLVVTYSRLRILGYLECGPKQNREAPRLSATPAGGARHVPPARIARMRSLVEYLHNGHQ